VLATEAMRRASNATAILEAIRSAANIGVHVLAPQVETLFGAVMGSRSAFVHVSRGGLFLDLGGGSVQMTWLDTRLQSYETAAALVGESMPFGAARLIRVLEDESAEAQASEKGKLRSSLLDAFAKLCDTFPALREAKDGKGDDGQSGGIDVYLCGGGFRGYGSILMHTDAIQPYPIPSIGAYTVPGHVFKQTDKMRKVNDEQEGKIFGMSKRRRRQFPAIITVVEAFIGVVPNIRTATFCSGSNRDGALLMKLPKSLRESNPLEALADFPECERPAIEAVLTTISGALPSKVGLSSTATIFSLGLGHVFARQIWARLGEDGDSNASFALHDAITRDPSAPGLTHLARAVLGLTLCARWGSNLGPNDAQLYKGLKGLVHTADNQANFWAAYIGAVAAVIGILIPVQPKQSSDLAKVVRLVENSLLVKCRERNNLADSEKQI
jgi:retrograde regulation protein 2